MPILPATSIEIEEGAGMGTSRSSGCGALADRRRKA
jgi:hypothetical protein